MHQHPRPLHMPEEVMPQAHAFVRPLDNPRNIDHHKRLPAVLDHTQHRLQRGERVIRHLGPRRTHNRKQARLPGVGQADYAHISQQLQLKPQVQRLTRLALLRKQWVLIRRRCEVGVAPAPTSAIRQVHRLTRRRQVGKHQRRLRGRIPHLRPDWHPY